MPLDWDAAEEYKETCELLESSRFVDDFADRVDDVLDLVECAEQRVCEWSES